MAFIGMLRNIFNCSIADQEDQVFLCFFFTPIQKSLILGEEDKMDRYLKKQILEDLEEKMVFLAVHILKWIFYQQDCFGRRVELMYYRDKQQREVDFVVVENNRPLFFVESKYADSEISKGLIYLKNKFPEAKAYQVMLEGKKEYVNGIGIQIVSALKFLRELDS